VRVAELTADEANARAREQADLALEALDGVEIRDTTARDYLADLAEFVVTREY
nr:polyprenyl synthetase family protein [Actinomycetota bacterium]NIU68265.1 polyprenyl synthetase family protein [Actinomycetota bacterium]NIW30070.1 polyprenyl synthetase family protein [Actinomycetota bacterium]